MKAKAKVQPIEVYNALHDLGLTEEILVTAILEGEQARNNCTPHDPRCVPGVFAWARCVRSLRDQLVLRGWTRNDDYNRAVVVSPDGRATISVETGNEGTGIEELMPGTKYQKGEAAVRAIRANQPTLFEMSPTVHEIFPENKPKNWMLLRRPAEGQIFAELLLPAPLVDGRIERWLDRIILNSIPFEYDFAFIEDADDEPIDIQISRRQ